MLADYLSGRLAGPEMDAVEEYLQAHPEALAGLSEHEGDRLEHQIRRAVNDGPILPADTIAPGPETAEAPAAPALNALTPPELQNHPRYQVLRQIGQGGMGDVYLAEHKIMRRLVALKLIRNRYVANAATIERFHREINAAARLNHPNIVAAYDAEQVGDTHFLAMDYVEGESLKEYLLRQKTLPIAEACDIVRQVALGLQHAHEKRMVHRDIKPHNLMRTPEGQVKILDFGLAVLRAGETAVADATAHEVAATLEHDAPVGSGGHAATGKITGSGAVMGTPDYIAPEQVHDTRTVDIRADIYSLGCTVFQLLTGRPPFDGGSTADKLAAHQQDTAESVRSLRPDVPETLATIVETMLAKSPANRFQTPKEVAEAVLPFVNGLVAPSARRRRPLSLARIAAALFMLAVSIAAAVGIYRITNTRGDEYTITTDDPNIEVIVKNGGKDVCLFDPVTKQKLKLDTEKHQLSDADRPEGLTIELPGQEPFVLRRRGERIATVTRTALKGDAKLIDLNPDARQLKFLRKHPWPVRNAYESTFSPDGKYYRATGDMGNGVDGVRVWETATGKAAITVAGAGWLTFSADCRRVMTRAINETVIQGWDLESKKRVQEFKGHTFPPSWGAETSDGTAFVSSGGDETIRIWNSETRKTTAVLTSVGRMPFFSLSGDAASLIVNDLYGVDPLIRLFDVKTQKLKRTWTGPKGLGMRIALSASGQEFYTYFGPVDRSKSIWQWRIDQDAPVRRLTLPEGNFQAAAFSSDLQWMLFTVGTERKLRLLNLTTGKVIASHDLEHGALGLHGFSGDNRFAAFTTHGPSTVYVFEMPAEVKPPAVRYSVPLAYPTKERPFVPDPSEDEIRLKAVTDFREAHGLDLARLRTWLTELPAEFRPADITYRAGSDPPVFDAIAIHDHRRIPYEVHLDLDRTGTDTVKDWTTMTAAGWSLRIVCPYTFEKSRPRHHAWFKSPPPWTVLGRPLHELDANLAKWRKERLRPVRFYRDGFDLKRGDPSSQFGTLLEADDGLAWEMFPEVKATDLVRKVAEARQRSFRPDALGGFWHGAHRTFAISLVPNPGNIAWECRTNMTLAEYEAALAEQKSLRRRPLAVSSEQDGAQVRYSALWIEYSLQK